MRGVHCFLNEPEWQWLFAEWPATSPVQAAHGAVMPQFSSLADLMPDIRSACGLNGSVTDAQALVPQILAVKDGICRAREDVHLMLGWKPLSTSLTSQDTRELNDTPPDENRAEIEQAVWACPTQALSIREEDD